MLGSTLAPLGASGQEFESSTAPAITESNAEPTGDLTLREAVAFALLNSPRLAGFELDVRIAEATTLQSGLLPNPELEVEVEEFAGTDEMSDFDAAEISVLLSQRLELGGKRGYREQIARHGEEISQQSYEVAKLGLVIDLSKAFTSVLASQERRKFLQDSVQLASQAMKAAETRFDSGDAPQTDALRARAVLASAQSALTQEERKLESARLRLAALYGSSEPEFSQVVGKLHSTAKFPELSEIRSQIDTHPQMALLTKLVERQETSVEQEQAERIPDVTVGLGAKYFNADDASAAVFQFSMPLPLFDRNQGNILKARHELRKARENEREARINLLAYVTSVYRQLESFQSEIKMVDDDWLESAQSAQEKTWRAYNEGKANYLDLIEAQRGLTEARIRHVDVLEAYQNTLVELEILIQRRANDTLSVSSTESENTLEAKKDHHE
ncbi:MAG: TolC family protein [Coraliomargarita sp.]